MRKKYHAFEGQLKGYDSRILVAQVPGGMLTNLEGQLKQQNAADKLDQVLATLAGTEHDTGLDILKLESIAAYFREVRKKYHAFEGQLKG